MNISKQESIRCGWCGEKSKLGEWNDLTYSKCTNREMKRAFTNLTDSKAFLRKSDTFYICPKCSKWSRGSQLSIVDTDNPLLLKLGGESAINTINKE